MAAAVILNLLFLFILVKRRISGSMPLHLRQSAAEIFLFVQKSKMVADAIFDSIFVQYFGIPACRTSSVICLPNFVQICAIVNELLKINEI